MSVIKLYENTMIFIQISLDFLNHSLNPYSDSSTSSSTIFTLAIPAAHDKNDITLAMMLAMICFDLSRIPELYTINYIHDVVIIALSLTSVNREIL